MHANENNKTHNGMKADILEIIQQYKLGHIPEEQTIKELCDLFSVVGQSEQLLALAKYMCQHQNNIDGLTAKDYLQDFLSQ